MTALDPSSLEALALRVESGSGADRRLDYELFVLFAERDRSNFWDPNSGHHFTTSLDAVKALIETKLPGWAGDVDLGARSNDDSLYGARLFPPDDRTGDRFGFNCAGEATSPERALLAASLRALAQKEEG